MFSSKVFLILSVLVAVSFGKWVKVKNGHSTALVVTADGVDYTVASNGLVALDLADAWEGSISAVPVGAEVVDGPRTKAELSLSAADGDSYGVSLVDGFNLALKIVPNGATNCSTSVCAAKILSVCPMANQVTSSSGTVVACQNTPTIMTTLCPLAVVNEATLLINTQSCKTATSYMILFS